MAEIPDLPDEEWAEILERLTLHAAGGFRKCGWQRGHRSKWEWAGPGGSSPEDIALETIGDVLGGTRVYNQERYPDFREFLHSVVDSKISHMVEKAVRRRTGRMPVALGSETATPVEEELPGKFPDPADVCVNREIIELARSVVEADAEKDPLVSGIFECLEAEITKPAEIADFLDVDVSKIYNAQKRLHRKLDRAFRSDKEGKR